MIILDSNIVIYSAQPEYRVLRELFRKQTTFVSIISKIEVLGYHLLTEEDSLYFEAFFRKIKPLPINPKIIDIATNLRQQRKIGLGDAIIAATAIHHNYTLYSRNIADFSKIVGISSFNPIP